MVADIIARSKVPVKRIVASGGGTRVPGWVQALADCTGLPIEVSAVQEGAALGIGVPRPARLGLESTLLDASRWAAPRRPLTPTPRGRPPARIGSSASARSASTRSEPVWPVPYVRIDASVEVEAGRPCGQRTDRHASLGDLRQGCARSARSARRQHADGAHARRGAAHGAGVRSKEVFVLVVDDSEDIRVTLHAVAVGRRVQRAPRGERAEAMSVVAHADVVVTDLMMPEVSGIDLLRATAC